MPMRKPFALANWKMAMTLAQTDDFLRKFLPRARNAVDVVETVICPPFTAIARVANAVSGTPVQVGAQNIHVGQEEKFTGEVSASLVSEAGSCWGTGNGGATSGKPMIW